MMRLVRKAFGAALAALTAGSAAPRQAPDIIRSPRAIGRTSFRVVSQSASADGKSATYVFEAPGGIFSFDLDLAGTQIESLTFVVKDEAYCEGLGLRPSEKEWIDLRRQEGVTISAAGKDVVIRFGPPAVAVLRKGGRLWFINQYR